MNPEEKYELITQNLQEVVDEEKLKNILTKRNLKVYWGTAPTGKPHLGYFVPMFKIADLLKAGCEVTILFADIHAYLDNMKSTWKQLNYRTQYYEILIKEMLKLVNVPLDKLKFVKGSEFQTKKQYTLDVYKMSALASTRDTQKAGAEVVKQVKTPKMSGLLYPILQAIDEVYLDVDAQFGGVDQRKIFMFARTFLPKIGYDKRIHLMNPLVPGLTQSGKMSSSEPNSKIDFTDTNKQIRKKINKAYSADGEIEGNGLLAILKHIIFVKLKHENKEFIINRPEQYGGKISFKTYQEVEKAFATKELSSIDLKQGLAEEIIQFIQPIRELLETKKELYKKSYGE
jgi:tyrosyl-tRNA synthetase